MPKRAIVHISLIHGDKDAVRVTIITENAHLAVELTPLEFSMALMTSVKTDVPLVRESHGEKL